MEKFLSKYPKNSNKMEVDEGNLLLVAKIINGVLDNFLYNQNSLQVHVEVVAEKKLRQPKINSCFKSFFKSEPHSSIGLVTESKEMTINLEVVAQIHI